MHYSRFIIGNWKMHGLFESLSLLDEIQQKASFLFTKHVGIKTIMCLPATLLQQASLRLLGDTFTLGAQDCSAFDFGAYTGDISPPMLYNAGARYVLLGHSERRIYHKETNQEIFDKIHSAWRGNLIPIFCIGELLTEKEAGKTYSVLREQIFSSLPQEARADNVLLAYEPVWAINSQLTPDLCSISQTQDYIRSCLLEKYGETGKKIPILYGGAVNESNADSLFTSVPIQGLLVGRASLSVDSFVAILKSAYKNL